MKMKRGKLDVILFNLGFSKTLYHGQTMIKDNLVLVNNVIETNEHYILKPFDGILS